MFWELQKAKTGEDKRLHNVLQKLLAAEVNVAPSVLQDDEEVQLRNIVLIIISDTTKRNLQTYAHILQMVADRVGKRPRRGKARYALSALDDIYKLVEAVLNPDALERMISIHAKAMARAAVANSW